MFHFSTFHESVTDGRTDGPTDGRTDRPSYRDARTHLKREGEEMGRERPEAVDRPEGTKNVVVGGDIFFTGDPDA